MSVYVDSMMPCITNANWRWRENCHLIADSIAELDGFAERLGLKREWFQSGTLPHYDLTANKRARAIQLGAVEIERDEVVRRIRALRLAETRKASSHGVEIERWQ